MERKEIENLVRKQIEEKLKGTEKREYIVAANWKMNMSEREAKGFLERLNTEEIPACLKTIIFPPYPYLGVFKKILRYSRITYGAQDVAKEEKGAYTGEVSAGMLLDMGCSYTLTGHSERRRYYGETPDIVARKTKTALKHQITPIVCIGETLKERKSGRHQEVIKQQLDAVRSEAGDRIKDCIIAYEPVWAIGTGVIPQKSEIAGTHKFIYDTLVSYGCPRGKVPGILYGGSVTEKNVKDIAAVDHVDGFLIGGASLRAEGFISILNLLTVDG